MAKSGLPKGMAQQLQALQQQLADVQEEIAQAEVTGSAGGGVVKINLRGDQTCTGVQIDPEMLSDADADMLQDLILAAFNQAQKVLAQLTAEKMGPFQNMLGF